MAATLPPNLGAPVRRALEGAGVTTADDVAKWTESDLLALHGVGPKAVAMLRPLLASRQVEPGGDSRPSSAGARQVDEYLAGISSPQRETLVALRATIRSILPHADEAMKYGMPAFTLGGKGVAGYAAFKNHCGYFPMSSGVVERAGEAVAKYEQSKGGFRFGTDERLPVGLVRRLVKLRIEEISAVQSGPRSEYYGDGRLEAEGRMKGGKLHGRWKWFRSDGTLMRTGQFADGAQVGTWTTWNRDGTASKATEY